MRKVYQTKFGNPDGPEEKIGNCYPACVATILGKELHEVPHFYATGYEWWDILGWAKEHGYSLLPFDLPIPDEWAQVFEGELAIVSGPSPRFEDGTMHAVVGRMTRKGWELIHDPHPEGDGFSAPAVCVEIVFRRA